MISNDLATSLRIVTVDQAATFLGMSAGNLRRQIKYNKVYARYFWNAGDNTAKRKRAGDLRTSLLLLGLMELELAGLAVPGEKIIQSFISTLLRAA